MVLVVYSKSLEYIAVTAEEVEYGCFGHWNELHSIECDCIPSEQHYNAEIVELHIRMHHSFLVRKDEGWICYQIQRHVDAFDISEVGIYPTWQIVFENAMV